MAVPPNNKALNGTLASPADGPHNPHTFFNGLEVPITIFWLDGEGRQLAAGDGVKNGAPGNMFEIEPKTTRDMKCMDGYHLVLTASSGAYVGTLGVNSTLRPWKIAHQMLVNPNEIGPFPEPTDSTLIPADSPRILVACGMALNGNIITREQYWRRTSDSYSLAPGQTHTIGFSTTSGLQTTTSEQREVAASLGASASASWGTISASASASLSKNSTSSHQISISSETRRYETVVLKNPSDSEAQVYFKWQLMDVITIFDKAAPRKPLSSIILAQTPVMLGGPY